MTMLVARTPELNGWSRLAIAEIGVFAVCLGYWIFQVELPYVDTFSIIDYVARRSWSGVWTDVLTGNAEYRPLYFILLKAVHDMAGGPNLVVFRTIQLGLIITYLSLFYSLLGPRDIASWLGFTVGMCCLTGLHTAYYTFNTAIPLFSWSLIVNGLMFGAIVLMRRPPSIGLDVAAVAMSMVAVLTIETGVAVGLIWITAGLARWGAARYRTASFVLCGFAICAAIRLLTNAQPIPGPFYTETGCMPMCWPGTTAPDGASKRRASCWKAPSGRIGGLRTPIRTSTFSQRWCESGWGLTAPDPAVSAHLVVPRHLDS